ncbi:hypothetical protein Halxa_2581 [Halopiger xanaduensis SH-6]|uniref:Uncharacterized protein n=1 Tax=Halopiger xanaduensis (strain DSM 18323 / JCM 14033 / SH-6) TaxID=797210 RepID=F8DC80_HALXS|nr:hypothetical protein Halxa_2581 [Halopiger xanaduensis SH-6]
MLATGALAATGAVVGGSHAVGAAETDAQHEESTTALRGAMFPYHYAPASRAAIVETDLEWLPERLSGYQTHVLEYGHARSFRGFLFAEEGEDGNGNENENDDGTPSSLQGRTVSLERTNGAPASASNLIGVEATVLEGD